MAQSARRRDNGTGSIAFDKDAQCWIGIVDLGVDAAGRRRRTKVRATTRAEVRTRLDDLVAQRALGVDLSQRATTMADLARLWLERGVPPGITENTQHNYGHMLSTHVLPVLGHHRLVDLRSEHVEGMLDVMAEAGLAASTMRHALNLTRRVLRFGMARDLVARNVADPVHTRPGPRADRYGLTPKQARKLLAVAAGDRLGNLVTLSLMLGLRPGEAAGLTWPEVKLKGKRPSVTVSASLRRTPMGALVLVPPKTRTSNRTLEIPPPVAAALKAQRASQKADRQVAGSAWRNRYDLVFTTELGTPLDPSNVRRTFSRLARLAGLEHLHPHMLRHAAASLLSAAGVPIEDISDTLGHRSVTVTAEIYRHPIAPVRSGHVAAMTRLASRDPGELGRRARTRPSH